MKSNLTKRINVLVHDDKESVMIQEALIADGWEWPGSEPTKIFKETFGYFELTPRGVHGDGKPTIRRGGIRYRPDNCIMWAEAAKILGIRNGGKVSATKMVRTLLR